MIALLIPKALRPIKVHAQASLKFLLRKKLRQARGENEKTPSTPTPLPLPKELQEPKDQGNGLEHETHSFNRQISAPAAVNKELSLKEALKKTDEKKKKGVQDYSPASASAAVQGTKGETLKGEKDEHRPDVSWALNLPCREQMPPVSPAECGFRLLCGSHQMPHPQKASSGGEDSYFLCANGSAAGKMGGT
ncbi:hypothetical protein AK812_SmicGene44532, partial [Symbiodinium microadriaticum]